MDALLLKNIDSKPGETINRSIVFFMKLILLLPATALLLSATMHPPLLPTSASGVPLPSARAPKMWVENEQAFMGETILLRFQTPHPQFLGVVDPDGKFFYIVFPAAQSMGNLTPLVDSKAFVRLDRLEISTTQLKADPYKYGVTENQPVFTKSGAYAFILGDNLHTDDPTTMHRVKVKYKHTARPAPRTPVLN